MDAPRSNRRVVITGLGVIAPNGCDLGRFWKTIRDGQSAACPVTRIDVSQMPVKIGCEIRNWSPEQFMDKKTARRLDRSIQYGVAAARLAARDAGLDFTRIDPDRTGVVEATSVSNNESAARTQEIVTQRGYRAVSLFAMINGYAGGGSGEIAIELGIKGHAITMSTGSASGNDVMGYALGMLQNDDADVMVAGGDEAPIIDSVWGGFCQGKVMTRHTGAPAEAMKPFDAARDGFVLGEGAAFVVLEELTHALTRGAKIYAEVLAHGRSCEGFHPVAPHPEGLGLRKAMEKALRRARIDATEVDYINAHGTATESNDPVETLAIKRVFGPHAHRLAISSTKPVTGHLMAAAGALETVATALAIKQQIIPPTLNLRQPEPACDLDYVPFRARPYPIRAAMNLSVGFGGKNACLLLRQFDARG